MRRILCIFLLLTVVFSFGCQKPSTTREDNNQILLMILSMRYALGLNPDDECFSAEPHGTLYVEPTVLGFNQPVSGQKQGYRVFDMKKGDTMVFTKSIADSSCKTDALLFVCSFLGKIDEVASGSMCDAGDPSLKYYVELSGSTVKKTCSMSFDTSGIFQNFAFFYLYADSSKNANCKYTFEVRR